jgi:short-subunit dehydrogenase involved in D-alanine esterification of teichoic acids
MSRLPKMKSLKRTGSCSMSLRHSARKVALARESLAPLVATSGPAREQQHEQPQQQQQQQQQEQEQEQQQPEQQEVTDGQQLTLHKARVKLALRIYAQVREAACGGSA